jgi:hypothetical protein
LCNTADKFYNRDWVSPLPDKPTYIHRLTSILAEAKTPKPIPFFRRGDIEALFGLKRRQAINLMHQIGAIRVSHEIAIPQRDLVSWLEKMALGPARTREIRRQERVIGRIVELKAENAARAVKIVLPDSPAPAGLPTGVSLQPGILTISFTNEQELLERLFLLARAFATKPELLSNLAKR